MAEVGAAAPALPLELARELEPASLAFNIPKLWHQTGPSRDVGPRLEEVIGQVVRLNPGWRYTFYDDADMLRVIGESYGPETLRVFRMIDRSYGAARADLFRYLVLYRYGGVYLDLKSSARVPFDQVLGDDPRFVVSQWDNRSGDEHEGWGLHPETDFFPGGEVQQWFLASPPRHPLLRAVIEGCLIRILHYRPWIDDVGMFGVLNLTGPLAYTRDISEHLNDTPHRRVRDHRELGLTYSSLPRGSHKHLLGRHYAENWRPLVRRAGLTRLVDIGYALGRRIWLKARGRHVSWR